MFGVLLGEGKPQVQYESIILLISWPIIIIGLRKGFFIYLSLSFYFHKLLPLSSPLQATTYIFLKTWTVLLCFHAFLLNAGLLSFGMGRRGLAKHAQQWSTEFD